MSNLFVIRNQGNLYLSKQGEWLNGGEVQPLFRTPHHDIALNTLIEHNAKDISLRCDILSVEGTDKGQPIVEVLAQAQLPMTGFELPEHESAAPTEHPPEPTNT